MCLRTRLSLGPWPVLYRITLAILTAHGQLHSLVGCESDLRTLSSHHPRTCIGYLEVQLLGPLLTFAPGRNLLLPGVGVAIALLHAFLEHKSRDGEELLALVLRACRGNSYDFRLGVRNQWI
jgi:hypothetical protein